MPFEALEEKRVFQHAEHVADAVWDLSEKWSAFAKQVVGSQMIRAADSIGANVSEAAGRFHPADVCNFFSFARGSLYETRYWLRRAQKRKLITEEQLRTLIADLDQLAREVNSCITHQRSRSVKPAARRSAQPPKGTAEPVNDPTT